jgi:hypothetical protein
MPATTARHQHRHFKTLIVLVLSMTGGTMFLFWVGGLAPVTPLRGKTVAAVDNRDADNWSRISVRAQRSDQPLGFHHFRIDQQGRISEDPAWQTGQQDSRTPGTVHVVLSCDSTPDRVRPIQTKVLSRLIADLRAQYHIPKDQVRIDRHG